MNLIKHYDSYRAAVLRDALDEGSWYAKQIKTTQGLPVYDWLSTKVEDIQNCARLGLDSQYRVAVESHQTGLIALYEAMVADHLWDYRNPTPQQLLDLIDEQGTNWFKFARRHLKIPTTMPDGSVKAMVWIPRYVFPWLAIATSGPDIVAFDADELQFMRGHMDLARDMFRFKLQYPTQKIFGAEGTGFSVAKPWLCNTETVVRDWTAPLFLKPEDMQQ